MNRLVLVALLVVGCHGDPVDSVVADAGVVDTAVADAADAATTACNPTGNLLANGDFASGTADWRTFGATLQLLPGAGPCGGNGVRVVTNSGGYGSIAHSIGGTLKAGTKVRVRAFFKKSGTGAANPPILLASFVHVGDAGTEVPGDTVDAGAVMTDAWTATENTVVLTQDCSRVEVNVSSRAAGADEFAVGAISVVVE